VKTRKSSTPRMRTSSIRRFTALKSSTHSETGEWANRPKA
jgi:hypothetical protein